MSGYPLGGTSGSPSSNNGSNNALSADEMRRRRLAALEGSSSRSAAAAAASSPSTPIKSAMKQQSSLTDPVITAPPSSPTSGPQQQQQQHLAFLEDDDGDAELQAALALSLQAPISPDNAAAASSPMDEEQKAPAAPSKELINTPMETNLSTTSTTTTTELSQSSVPPQPADIRPQVETRDYDIAPYHALMWDTSLTTENDQWRWVGQGMDIGGSSGSDGIPELSLPQAAAGAAAAASSPPQAPQTPEQRFLDHLAQQPLAWGLQQQHGGPCGVLAAVQAELVRVLVYESEPRISNFAAALAHALARILVRAALVGVTLTRQQTRSTSSVAASVPATTGSTTDTSAASTTPPLMVPSQLVIPLVLPQSHVAVGAVGWSDLEPWNRTAGTSASTTSSSSSSASLHRQVLTLTDTVQPPQDLEYVAVAPSQHQLSNNNSQHNKRQKTTAVGETMDPNSDPEERIRRFVHAVAHYLLQPNNNTATTASPSSSSTTPLHHLRAPGGVLLFTMSVVEARGGAGGVKGDLDDPSGSRLTSQFGHCSQELMNLLLTGEAVSNVFDNTVTLAADMVCRGITRRPDVGYLTQLEALRYCQVGSYFKSPRFPVWVIGSTSHFTVVFGTPEALRESASDVVLEDCTRAFKAAERGDDTGFIPATALGGVLQTLGLNLSPPQVETLAATLEVTGAGIILWDGFWKAASRLLTGASLDTVLQGDDDMAPIPMLTSPDDNPSNDNNNAIMMEGVTPTPMVEAGALLQKNWHPIAASPMESDEEFARRLQAKFKEESAAAGMMALSSYPPPLIPVSDTAADSTPTTMPMGSSDEEFARKLQAEWDAEDSGGNAISGDGSVKAVAGDSQEDEPWQSLDEDLMDTKPAAKNVTGDGGSHPVPAELTTDDSTMMKGRNFVEFGNSFELFHYNGLYGGKLSSFRVTRLTAEEAIGHSIALDRGSSGASQSLTGTADLEDIVRTKWPSCMIDWKGKPPPAIN